MYCTSAFLNSLCKLFNMDYHFLSESSD
uniref:Uncharacterized protein n=1 Tax=Anguilla anguilla TaxID=7936 RepID=A0A0E9TUB6_ANGAN